YEFFNGATDQAVCATLQGYFAEWNDPLQDYCYLYLRLEYKQAYFKGMPKVNVVLEGKKVYDPRYPETPPPSDLIAWWGYNEPSGASVEDLSGNGYEGTIGGNDTRGDGISGNGVLMDGV
ncbi:unnamed protein product, partial [marine sediment metagenome]